VADVQNHPSRGAAGAMPICEACTGTGGFAVGCRNGGRADDTPMPVPDVSSPVRDDYPYSAGKTAENVGACRPTLRLGVKPQTR
jgi:hypothetical protein